MLVSPKTMYLCEGVVTDESKVLIRLLKQWLLQNVERSSSEFHSTFREVRFKYLRKNSSLVNTLRRWIFQCIDRCYHREEHKSDLSACSIVSKF